MAHWRAEVRTAESWNRFDRVAVIGAAIMALLLVVVSAFSDHEVAGEAEPQQLSDSTSARAEAAKKSKRPDAAEAAGPTAAGEPLNGGSGAAMTERLAGAGPTAKPARLPVPQVGTGPRQSDVAAAAKAASGAAKPRAGAAPASAKTVPDVAGTPAPGAAAFDRIETRIDKRISAEPEQGSAAAPNAADELVKPILELRSADGRLTIDGIVGNEKTRASIVQAALKAYGMRNLTDRLAVSASVAPFSWADRSEELMVLVGGPETDSRLRIDGEMVSLAGEVSSLDEKQTRALQAQQLFGVTAVIDNRMRIKPPTTKMVRRSPEAEAAASPADKPAGGESPPPEAAAQAQPEAGAAAGAAPAAASSRDPAIPADAEGGPQAAAGEILLSPRGAPDKFLLRECARVMTSIYLPFASASGELTPEARQVLDDIVPCLPRRNYTIGGHTDNRGSSESNKILSQIRAQNVLDYLVSKGASADGLKAEGYGESRPVATNRTENGRARNRRVDFRLDP
ncbi:MAG: OmpA family protein [Burkholderiaceae bacterium]